MIRNFVIFDALCTLLASEPNADADRGSPDCSSSWSPSRAGRRSERAQQLSAASWRMRESGTPMALLDCRPNFRFRRPAHRLERAFKMTKESVQREREPLIKADLGENGGRIEFESIPDASQWIDREIEAWRKFGETVGSSPLREKVLDRQLALPLKIAERLAQAISLEGDELLQTAMEIEGLLEKYADYHSLHSESGLGMTIRKIKTPRSQRTAIGGLACSIGIPAYEVLDMGGPDDQGIVDVVTGYAMGRELNVVKRSEISRHEERMGDYIR